MFYRLSVFLHIAAACVWVGGIGFFALVLVPVLRRSRDAKAAELVRAVGVRFRVVGWASVAVLIVTGIVNLLVRVPLSVLLTLEFWQTSWGQLLAAKLGLVALMTLVSAWHDVLGARASQSAARDATAPDARRERALASLLGRALGVVTLTVVFFAVLLVRGW